MTGPARALVALGLAAAAGACGGDDALPPLPGTYELVAAGGVAPPILFSDQGGIRMYIDSMYVEFAEDTARGADGVYVARWRVEHRQASDDSTYFVAHTEDAGTWSYTSDVDIEVRYANGGLRTRGTHEGRELELRQFFSFDIEDWRFRRTDAGPDLVE